MLHIKITGLDALAAKVNAQVDEFKKTVGDGIALSVATRGIAMAVENTGKAKPRPPVDRGQYRASFKAIPIEGGAILTNSAPYAGIIENGRRAGAKMPPVDVIARWVIRKGILNKGKGKSKKQPTAAQVRSVAYVIARKIAEKGWPAPPNHPMAILEKTGKQLEKYLEEDILRYWKLLQHAKEAP